MNKEIRMAFEAIMGLLFLIFSCIPLILVLDEEGEKQMKDKIIGCLLIAGIIILIIAIVACAIIEVWVVNEYGDLPITEVPSWTIPWLK